LFNVFVVTVIAYSVFSFVVAIDLFLSLLLLFNRNRCSDVVVVVNIAVISFAAVFGALVFFADVESESLKLHVFIRAP
jgi:hypothetical protein